MRGEIGPLRDERRAGTRQSSVREIGGFARLFGLAFIIFMPFATIRQFGLLGNFDSNLSLYPFLILAPLLFISAHPYETLSTPGSEGIILRSLLLSLSIAGIFTILNGFELKGQGQIGYGVDPLAKSLVTAIVPLFISLVYVVSVSLARGLNKRDFHWGINISFWASIAYIFLQISSILYSNTIYDYLWPWAEGAKDYGGLPYLKIYRRLNGSCSEPAELVKLIFLFFLPWIVYPAIGGISWPKFGIASFVVVGCQSLTGIALIVAALVMMLRSGAIKANVKMYVLFGLLIAGLVGSVVGVELLSRVIDRASAISNDESAQVRGIYNLIAIETVKDHPWYGIGWSNEIYYFPDRLRGLTGYWEIRQDLKEGISLTARSMFLRLVMYMGVPVFLYLVVTVFRQLRRGDLAGSAIDHARTRLAFVLFAIGGLLDGGIVTSFFMWAGTAFPIGYQLRSAGIRRNIEAAQRPSRKGRMILKTRVVWSRHD